MKRFSLALVGCLAMVSSIATSEPTPPASSTTVQVDDAVTMYPGDVSYQTFRLSILLEDLEAVGSSYISVNAVASSPTDDFAIGMELQGYPVLGWSDLTPSQGAAAHTIRLDEPFDGCNPVGAYCYADWNVNFDHHSGEDLALVSYTTSLFVDAPDLDVSIDAI